ncbi:MAG: hypothetical protein IPL46_29255 [Saprospiraceae bacterium]|nr:hypothetical protein [Saprospiraceae bacterium]
MSSSVILDLFNIRLIQGNYVSFIVWTNLICSFIYLISTYGLLKSKSWTVALMGIASLILVAAFSSLKIYIAEGGIYEIKTVSAVIFRISMTLALTIVTYFLIPKKISLL